MNSPEYPAVAAVYVSRTLLAARTLLALAAAVALAGCYADLDWREVRPPGGGFVVMLPGRVTEESRPLSAALPGVTMHQWSAKARNSLFAAGYADAGPGQGATPATLRDALLANIAGKVSQERAVAAGDVPGRETVAAGQASGGPVDLRLRLFAKGQRVYQVTLLSRPGVLSEDEMDSFFASFQLKEPQR